ncbi:MAG TPA: methyltransferase domain-containing protein [Polyangiaceae bacterium]|nr:methyltransferase domain-containing protein [Polyangiaceae bacterium]
MPEPADVRKFFDAIARRYDRVYARPRDEVKTRMSELLARLGAGPLDVLDLGVGTGGELPWLLDAGHRVTGLDVSEEMIALCKQRARPIPCVCADFWEGLPFADASFDAVLALFGSLAHPPAEASYPRLIAEVRRVLREGGTFYFEMPSPAWRAEHPDFTDAASGARIAIAAPDESRWRDWLSAGFEVASVKDDAVELRVVANKLTPRSPPSPAAR